MDVRGVPVTGPSLSWLAIIRRTAAGDLASLRVDVQRPGPSSTAQIARLVGRLER